MNKNYQNIIINSVNYDKEKIQTSLTNAPDLPSWKRAVFEFCLEWLNKNPTITATTSGTTGKPKTILLQKEKMVNSALKTGAFFKLERNVKALLCLAPKYIAGKMMIVRAFVLGLDLVLVEPTGNPLKGLRQQEIGFAAMVPLQVLNSFSSEAELTQLRLIEQTIIGGGVVSKSLHQLLQQEQNQFYATYGMTETITHIAIKKLNGVEASDHYTTLPKVSITTDTRGCLVIHAPDVAEEKVITNDLVKIITPDQFQWLGRFDNIINTGGVKVIPEEVEQILGKHLSRRFFISSIPDEKLGNQIILVVEGSHFSKNEKQSLINFMKANLPKYSIPKEIFYIQHFKETASGKVRRSATLAALFG
ncbi:MAG: AMP-binding protein [Bacteroidota bacterium]